MSFAGHKLADFPCDWCSHEEVEKLAAMFFAKMIEASLAKYPQTVSAEKQAKLLLQFIAATGLGEDTPKPYSFDKVEVLLNDYIGRVTKRMQMGKESVESRTLLVGSFFPLTDSRDLAKLLIKKTDIKFNYHCNELNCTVSKACPFKHAQCGNAPCHDFYSSNAAQEHDAICHHKKIPCDLGCGEVLPRQNMPSHIHTQCGRRTVPCPHADLGCAVAVLFSDRDAHLRQHSAEHFQLSLQALATSKVQIASLEQQLREAKEELDNMRI
jgi:hypothetical protein